MQKFNLLKVVGIFLLPILFSLVSANNLTVGYDNPDKPRVVIQLPTITTTGAAFSGNETDPRWSSNWTNMQFNCTTDNYVFGFYSNGSLRCRQDQTGGGGSGVYNETIGASPYLYNDTTTIYFNDSFANNTYNSRYCRLIGCTMTGDFNLNDPADINFAGGGIQALTWVLSNHTILDFTGNYLYFYSNSLDGFRFETPQANAFSLFVNNVRIQGTTTLESNLIATNVRASGYLNVTNITAQNLTVRSLFNGACDVKSSTSGNLYCGSDTGGGNPFDQVLNRTSNATYNIVNSSYVNVTNSANVFQNLTLRNLVFMNGLYFYAHPNSSQTVIVYNSNWTIIAEINGSAPHKFRLPQEASAGEISHACFDNQGYLFKDDSLGCTIGS